MDKINRVEQIQRTLGLVQDYAIELKRFQNAMDQHAGLNATDMECMRLLFLNQVSSPSELAKHTGLTSGATTAMLDRLETSGMLERKSNPNDRRGTLIVPAKGSIKKMAALFESARRAQTLLLNELNETELLVFSKVLEKFTALWKTEREKIEK